MTLGRLLTGTILVIGVGLALSGCVAEPVGYGPADYGYDGFGEFGESGEHGGFGEHGGEGEHGGFGGHGGGGGQVGGGGHGDGGGHGGGGGGHH
jgi:hypothetical protein